MKVRSRSLTRDDTRITPHLEPFTGQFITTTTQIDKHRAIFVIDGSFIVICELYLHIDSPVTSITKRGSEITRGQGTKGQYAIFARFAEFLPQAELGASYTAQTNEQTTSGELETRYFQPTDAFVEKQLQAAGVKKYVARHKFRHPMYMITGLKIAKGASSSRLQHMAYSGNAAGGVDLIAAGVPGAVGAWAAVGSSRRDNVSFEASDDFVLAFRLWRIYFEKGEAGTKEVGGGELYGLGDGEKELAEEEEENDEVIDFVGMGNVDVSPEEFQMKLETTLDDADDEECFYVEV